MAEIAFEHVAKVYPDGTQAVHDLELEIQDAELMVLVGPSGCGKTTLLSVLCGVLDADDGEIDVYGTRVTDLSARAKTAFRRASVGLGAATGALCAASRFRKITRMPTSCAGRRS